MAGRRTMASTGEVGPIASGVGARVLSYFVRLDRTGNIQIQLIVGAAWVQTLEPAQI